MISLLKIIEDFDCFAILFVLMVYSNGDAQLGYYSLKFQFCGYATNCGYVHLSLFHFTCDI